MYPPPVIGINMNVIENNWGQQVHFTNLSPPFHCIHTSLVCKYTEKKTSVFQIQLEFWVNMTLWLWLMYPPPFQYDYLILCLNRKLVNFNFKWIWIYGLEPHPPPLSSQKNEMLIFRLCSTSDDRPGWLMDSNPIHHPSPAKKMKCLFLDYIQLLMIGRAAQWTQTPSTTSLQPKK